MTCLLAVQFHDWLITLGTTFTGLAALSRDHFWRQRLFSFTQQIILFCGFYLLGSLLAMAFVTLDFSLNLIGVCRKLRLEKISTSQAARSPSALIVRC